MIRYYQSDQRWNMMPNFAAEKHWHKLMLNMAKLLPEKSLWPARKNLNQLRALLEPERHEFVTNLPCIH